MFFLVCKGKKKKYIVWVWFLVWEKCAAHLQHGVSRIAEIAVSDLENDWPTPSLCPIKVNQKTNDFKKIKKNCVFDCLVLWEDFKFRPW